MQLFFGTLILISIFICQNLVANDPVRFVPDGKYIYAMEVEVLDQQLAVIADYFEIPENKRAEVSQEALDKYLLTREHLQSLPKSLQDKLLQDLEIPQMLFSEKKAESNLEKVNKLKNQSIESNKIKPSLGDKPTVTDSGIILLPKGGQPNLQNSPTGKWNMDANTGLTVGNDFSQFGNKYSEVGGLYIPNEAKYTHVWKKIQDRWRKLPVEEKRQAFSWKFLDKMERAKILIRMSDKAKLKPGPVPEFLKDLNWDNQKSEIFMEFRNNSTVSSKKAYLQQVDAFTKKLGLEVTFNDPLRGVNPQLYHLNMSIPNLPESFDLEKFLKVFQLQIAFERVNEGLLSVVDSKGKSAVRPNIRRTTGVVRLRDKNRFEIRVHSMSPAKEVEHLEQMFELSFEEAIKKQKELSVKALTPKVINALGQNFYFANLLPIIDEIVRPENLKKKHFRDLIKKTILSGSFFVEKKVNIKAYDAVLNSGNKEFIKEVLQSIDQHIVKGNHRFIQLFKDNRALEYPFVFDRINRLAKQGDTDAVRMLLDLDHLNMYPEKIETIKEIFISSEYFQKMILTSDAVKIPEIKEYIFSQFNKDPQLLLLALEQSDIIKDQRALPILKELLKEGKYKAINFLSDEKYITDPEVLGIFLHRAKKRDPRALKVLYGHFGFSNKEFEEIFFNVLQKDCSAVEDLIQKWGLLKDRRVRKIVTQLALDGNSVARKMLSDANITLKSSQRLAHKTKKIVTTPVRAMNFCFKKIFKIYEK